ncbi:MAG: hypothetical protein LBB65_08535 [Burkholderiales bacterium]|jgi:hypothetical protein|nr:hypothetical protein [Burkholderiales bacterium]
MKLLQRSALFNIDHCPLIERDSALYRQVGLLDGLGLTLSLCFMGVLMLALGALMGKKDLSGSFFLLGMWGAALIGILVWRLWTAWRYGTFDHLLARVDSESVMLVLPGYIWPRRIEVPLPTLRIMKVTSWAVGFQRLNGEIKYVRPIYSRAMRADIISFLQRHLPASVTLEVNLFSEPA